MKSDFYIEKIQEIKEHIKKGDLNLAQSKLTEELNMPYIPMKYENDFLRMQEELNVLLKKEINNPNVPLDKLLEYLNGTDQEQVIALSNLSQYNLNNNKNYIARRIELWSNEENAKRAILYELLVEQNVDVNINLNGDVLNPKNGSILENNFYKKTIRNIEEMSAKFVQVENLAINELRRYLLYIFPNQLPIESSSEIAATFINIVKKMLGEDLDLTANEQKISDILSNFS